MGVCVCVCVCVEACDCLLLFIFVLFWFGLFAFVCLFVCLFGWLVFDVVESLLLLLFVDLSCNYVYQKPTPQMTTTRLLGTQTLLRVPGPSRATLPRRARSLVR